MAEKVTIGNINGRSAYQVAVDAGFVGTEQEWLDSLVGDVTPEAEEARDTAVGAASSASAAATTATEAAAVLAGVQATNDGIMTSVAADPESAFATQLTHTIGGFDVDLSAGDVTLANAPARVRLTGATGARTLTVPAALTSLFVDNDTAYDITLARSGSTSALVVLAGATVQIAGA